VAIIKDGASATELDVVNSSARVFLAGASGAAESYPLPAGVYMTPISMRHVAADVAGNIVFAIRNGGTRLLVVRRILIVASFDGTAAATHSEYQLAEFTGITADAGGVAQTPAKKRGSWPASTVTSVRGGGLLTLTGAVLGRTFAAFGAPRNTAGSTSHFLLDESNPDPYGGIEIDAGAGNALGIRLNQAANIGDTLRGWIEWEKR
jgi:hypothetical protein